MSKNIVKIFAGIGVVAGLGVALLPLSSYAASQDVNVSFKINATLGGNETICTSATNAPTGTAVVVGSNTAPVTNAAGTFTFGVQTATTTVADTYSDTVTIAITPAI